MPAAGFMQRRDSLAGADPSQGARMSVMTTSNRPAFHLAIPVSDLEAARAFYGGVLGLVEGRSSGV
jgi:hypothetical protein